MHKNISMSNNKALLKNVDFSIENQCYNSVHYTFSTCNRFVKYFYLFLFNFCCKSNMLIIETKMKNFFRHFIFLLNFKLLFYAKLFLCIKIFSDQTNKALWKQMLIFSRELLRTQLISNFLCVIDFSNTFNYCRLTSIVNQTKKTI